LFRQKFRRSSRRLSDLDRLCPITLRGGLFIALFLFFACFGWGFDLLGLEVRSNSYFWGWAITALSICLVFFLVFVAGWLALRAKASAFSIAKPSRSIKASGNWEPTGFRLHWLFSLLPLRVSVEWTSPPLDAIGGRAKIEGQREKVLFTRRGRFDKVERQILLEDWLGLFRLTFYSKSSHSFYVSSLIVDLENNFPVVQSAGETDSPEGRPEGDYLDMRAYRPGDPIKHMLWKLWAKTNGEQKFVRTPDPVSDEQLALFLFSHPADEPNARVLGKVASAKRNILFGAGTMGGSRDQRFITDQYAQTKEILLESGSWATGEVNSGCYKAFLESARRKMIGACWVFFPPGGEKEKNLVSLVREGAGEGVSYMVAHEKSNQGAAVAQRTGEFLKKEFPLSKVELHRV
jgi:hypothetical protein